uniref:Uncharacterized protein n=2 Tax=Romanomermis culicivorax TaxID=13658 RepID=A0A915HR79_ROMCU
MLLYKSFESMVTMMVSVGRGSRLLVIVAGVAVFLAIAVVVIAMRVMGIIMAIEMNGTSVARIAAVVGGIPSAGR